MAFQTTFITAFRAILTERDSGQTWFRSGPELIGVWGSFWEAQVPGTLGWEQPRSPWTTLLLPQGSPNLVLGSGRSAQASIQKSGGTCPLTWPALPLRVVPGYLTSGLGSLIHWGSAPIPEPRRLIPPMPWKWFPSGATT